MSAASLFVILVLAVIIVALVLDKMRPGLILFSGAVLFMCTGILTPRDLLEGFSNKGMVTVALLFLVSEGVRRSGLLEQLLACLLPAGALAVGVLLSCWQGVLGCALNGLGRQGAAARNSLLSGGVQLVCTYVLLGTPEVGVRGYAVGFVASAALGAGLNWLQVRRTAVMKARLFPWLVAPGLSALLMGLTGNLLFRFLLDSGAGELPAMGGCALFCGVLYLAALQAQGLPLRRLFSLS